MPWKSYAAALAVSLLCLSAISACSTIVPKTVKDAQASYDGNVQDSGLIGVAADGGFYVTEGFVDRYRALLVKWNHRFNPSRPPLRGIQIVEDPASLGHPRSRRIYAIMDAEAMNAMMDMSGWEKSGFEDGR